MRRTKYPKITKKSDGYWHAWVNVGKKPNGKADQRHVKRATEDEVKDRIDELLDQKRKNAVVKPGRGIKVDTWLDMYLDAVLPSTTRCDPDTIRDYRSLCEHWARPVIGRKPLADVETSHLREIYRQMRAAGRADSTVLKMHRVLSRSFEVARRDRYVGSNVAKDMDSPTFEAGDQTPLTEEEAQRVLEVASRRRNATRWRVALALGLRQGEALGLRKSFLDLERAEMRVWWQLVRRSFQHGCGGTCGRRRGGNCPQRVMPLRTGETNVLDLSRPPGAERRTAYVLKRPKGKGKRVIPIPEELVADFEAHLAAQEVERILASSLWQDHDFLFCQEDGSPIDPAQDHAEWKSILQEAGVPETRLHDGRHTAGTILILLGVPVEVVQEILGHSDIRTTRGYVHVASEMAKAATARIGRVLLGKASTPS